MNSGSSCHCLRGLIKVDYTKAVGGENVIPSVCVCWTRGEPGASEVSHCPPIMEAA